jgi:hypothetical protein
MTITVDPELNRLSKAPWPAYALVQMKLRQSPALFMFPRKCASNSIKQVLEKVSTFSPTNPWLTPREVTALDKSIPRVAVVREPLDRLKSAWRHAVVQHEAQFVHMNGIHKGTTWREFVHIVCNRTDAYTNYHMKSQSLELVEMVGGRMPDEILHIENLTREWYDLCVKRNWAWFPFGHLNPSDHTLETPVIPVIKRQVYVRYVQDYKNFYPKWDFCSHNSTEDHDCGRP